MDDENENEEEEERDGKKIRKKVHKLSCFSACVRVRVGGVGIYVRKLYTCACICHIGVCVCAPDSVSIHGVQV